MEGLQDVLQSEVFERYKVGMIRTAPSDKESGEEISLFVAIRCQVYVNF